MTSDPLQRIYGRVFGDMGGPSTPVAVVDDPVEAETMRRRLWGPMAAPKESRTPISPRWSEFRLERRLRVAEKVRRSTRALIDTFWAGCPEAERQGLLDDMMEIYADPAETRRGMPDDDGMIIHQAVHLMTSDEEFTARLVYFLVEAPSLEELGRHPIPADWADPVAREAYPRWLDALFADTVKYYRGRRILRWLGARVLALHREGRPLAGRFGDLYLFFRSHLPPSAAHLRWIDAACEAFSRLRAPGDERPLGREELEAEWDRLGGVPALEAGALELAARGGFVTRRFFGEPPTSEGRSAPTRER